MSNKDSARIPRFAHFYWGGEKLPYLRYLTLYTFKKFNPEWNLVLYVPHKLQTNIPWGTSEHRRSVYSNDYFDRVEKLGIKIVKLDMEKLGLSNELSEVHKSDYLRWHLLGTVGGIWSDMDIIFLQSIDRLVKGVQVLVCQQKNIWSIGFLGSSPNNSFFRKVFDEAKNKFRSNEYQCLGYHLLRSVYRSLLNSTRSFPQYTFRNMEMHNLYPVDSFNVDSIYNANEFTLIRPDTYGFHWYAGAKISGKYLGLIDENTYKNYSNLLSWTIQKALQ